MLDPEQGAHSYSLKRQLLAGDHCKEGERKQEGERGNPGARNRETSPWELPM